MKPMFLILLSLAVSVAVLAGTPREPISIRSDDAFTEENGVVGGEGTLEQPYRISGWQIEVPEGERYGIHIEGTTRAFVVEGCVITRALQPEGAALFFDGVQRGAVENTIVRDSRHGLELAASEDFRIRNTYLFVSGVGLWVTGATPEHFAHEIDTSNAINGREVHYYHGLEDETIEGVEAGHLTVANARNVVVRGASVEQGDGMTVAFSEGVIVEDVDLFQNRGPGLFIMSSPGTVLRDSQRIANNADAGVWVWLSDRVRVERSGFYANHTGLHVAASDRVIAEDNIYAANQVAIWVEGSAREVEVLGGLINGGTYGVNLESSRGARVERLAITELEIAVTIADRSSHAVVRHCTMVDVGYGFSITGSHNVVEGNLVARADIAVLFPETYGRVAATNNTVRSNLLHLSWEGLYLATDTRDNRVYENAFWDCERDARDVGQNRWAPQGRGNWYSTYEGADTNGNGIGDTPMDLGGGLVDEAPLVSSGVPPAGRGLLDALDRDTVELVGGDGQTVAVDVLVADSAHARFSGFQGLPARVAEELAVLFVWSDDVTSRFRMKHVFLPLDVLFFSADGTLLGKQSMEPDVDDLYGVRQPFRMALELPSGKLEAWGLADPVDLVL